MNLYLIGYRCTGKSTTGQRLAERLNRAFIDTDQLIEEQAGMAIQEIVASFGWDDFRIRENRILREAGEMPDRIVATGGGIVQHADNIGIMRETGVVIWLRADAETILSRLQMDPKTKTLRPALTDLSLSDEIKTTLSQRTPLYQTASHLVIDTDHRSVESITQILIDQLRSRYAGKFFRPDI